ncbi:juvenile hormone acid O-methyltransferase-like [Leguminivora glycinivorella]|uniref:juvenile hormone acid O-methyltransferase-like n=1 Tax=Leguminivora glycinivorella TaxID=1035111 RepID=UPI00200E9842|nr:juvenile hormone acid O-methyltransferase-like [Leguminivora glycinivorella]
MQVGIFARTVTQKVFTKDPKGYQKANNLQNRDLEDVLKEYIIKWKENASIMDIGCGDGSATTGLWTKYIPENFMVIVGSDKSQNCVNFAKTKYESERIKFMTLDIEDDLPSELQGCFDHVVSNYTFMWVQQQEKAFSNIYNLLAKDGNCLIIFLATCNIYENYIKLSRTSKWNHYLKDVKTKFISPYHESQDPETEIRSLMKKIGFRYIDIKVKTRTFEFVSGIIELKEMLKSFNPFNGLEHKWEDFMDDYVKLDPNAGTFLYKLLVVSGTR